MSSFTNADGTFAAYKYIVAYEDYLRSEEMRTRIADPALESHDDLHDMAMWVAEEWLPTYDHQLIMTWMELGDTSDYEQEACNMYGDTQRPIIEIMRHCVWSCFMERATAAIPDLD